MASEVAAGASGTPKRQSKVLDTAALDQFERLRRAELRQKLVNDGDSDDDEPDHKQRESITLSAAEWKLHEKKIAAMTPKGSVRPIIFDDGDSASDDEKGDAKITPAKGQRPSITLGTTAWKAFETSRAAAGKINMSKKKNAAYIVQDFGDSDGD